MEIYQHFQDIKKNTITSIVAGSFFQLRNPFVTLLTKKRLRNLETTLLIDVSPGKNSSGVVLLTRQERVQFFKQLGIMHYLCADERTFLEEIKKFKHEWGIQRIKYMSGLQKDGIDFLPEELTRPLSGNINNFEWHQELGYFYPLSGEVVEGNQIGRTLGYPTANLSPDCPKKPIPPRGVYAGWINLNSKWYKTMINKGIRPTLDLENVTIEANIFDYNDDLYGKNITLHFAHYIRHEMRFPSLELLKEQLALDKKIALALLDNKNIVFSEVDFLILTPN